MGPSLCHKASSEIRHTQQGDRGDISHPPQGTSNWAGAAPGWEVHKGDTASTSSSGCVPAPSPATGSRGQKAPTRPDLHSRQARQHLLLQQGEEEEHSELKAGRGAQTKLMAESRESSSDRSVHPLHVTLCLININEDLQFTAVLAFEDGG